MRKSNSIEKYHELAKSRGMEFIDESVPRYIKLPCRWRCKDCGFVHHKSYVTLKHEKNACRCRNGMQRPVKDYIWLAKMICGTGIEIVYTNPLVPRNIKQGVQWDVGKDCYIICSYSDLHKAAFDGSIREYVNGRKKVRIAQT